MQKKIIVLIVGLSLLTVTTAFTYPHVIVTNNEALLNFPESVTFSVTVTSDSEIRSIVLEYGNEQQTCGEVIAKAFPQFSPGKTVEAEWTWEMRQSGSLPPGVSLWWRWRVSDVNGNETVSETKTPTFVPTIVPVSGALFANQITPTAIPISSFGQPTPAAPVRTAPPLWLTLSLLGICCVMLLLVGMIALGVIVRNQNVKDANNGE